MTDSAPVASRAVTPSGLNHLVLNVRDLDESHRFWTEILGFRQVGEVPPGLGGVRRGTMRFYSGERGGKLHHHDVALVDAPDLPPPGAGPTPIGHVAIMLPDREAWLRQLVFLQSRGIKFERRVRARHDSQPLYPRPERLQHRVAV